MTVSIAEGLAGVSIHDVGQIAARLSSARAAIIPTSYNPLHEPCSLYCSITQNRQCQAEIERVTADLSEMRAHGWEPEGGRDFGRVLDAKP